MTGNRNLSACGWSIDRTNRQQGTSVTGNMGLKRSAVQDGSQPARDVAVIVETQHRVGLRKRLSELTPVTLGHAPDRND